MKHFKALRSRFQRVSPQVNFEELTRSLIVFNTDIGQLHKDMVSLPKARRGSVKIGERMFLDIFSRIGGRHIIEAGGNDGRHTRLFLESTDAFIHVFEPNVFASPGFEELFSNERLFFNAYGLSDATTLMPLALPRKVLSLDLGRVSGIASVEHSHAVSSAETHVAAFARAESYFETQPQIAKGPVGLWLDVEGHADLALTGFGKYLADRIDVALIEIEYDNLYARGANADIVLEQLQKSGLKVCYRDFMNHGQCNILAVSQRAASVIKEADTDARRFYKQITDRYAHPDSPETP